MGGRAIVAFGVHLHPQFDVVVHFYIQYFQLDGEMVCPTTLQPIDKTFMCWDNHIS
jgi:hypothetical protein